MTNFKVSQQWNEPTLDVERDEPLVDQRGVGVEDPAAQELPVVHGSGREGEGVGEDRRVALLQVVGAELRVGQVVGVHPLDLWGHVGAVVWSVARQLQTLVADDLLRDVDVGLVWGSENNCVRNPQKLQRYHSGLSAYSTPVSSSPRTLSSEKSGYVYMLAPPRSARK